MHHVHFCLAKYRVTHVRARKDYNGCTSQPQRLLLNILVELDDKTILIDIEVVNSQLDYNLLARRNYM